MMNDNLSLNFSRNMRKIVLITLLLVIFSGKLAIGDDQDFREFVRDVKKKIIIERSYKIGTEEELVLAPGQAAHLDFKDNPAGVAEFIFFYNNEHERVHIIYRCTDDTERQYNSTSLTLQRMKDFRGIGATGADTYLKCFTELEPKNGQSFVKFRTELPSEQEQMDFKKGQEEAKESKRRMEAIRQQAISLREWDVDQKVKPFNIIMDHPSDPNMIKLRKKYDLEGLVSKAKDDYGKLKLITGWVQKQWKHSGNNEPSKSDPLTILKEASEGKRFRCVEYAKVVAACARSLGMPSRVLALKRPDVETAKSGAGHVVAEVWLKQFNKWVFIDGQWGAIPEKNGVPLNAVELQDSIARKATGLKIRFASGGVEEEYIEWIVPYLYYFDFNLDQRFYDAETEKERISGSKGKIMLVPKGAKRPEVFQKNTLIKNCTYISNPKAFYPQMNIEN
jgi:hypothetical protein